MKVKSALFLMSFVLLIGFNAHSETIYVTNQLAVVGCANNDCYSPGNLRYATLFGVDKKTDQELFKLNVQKKYRCEADGTFLGILLEDNFNNGLSSRALIYKVYSMTISACTELDHSTFMQELNEREQKTKDIKNKIQH